MLDLTQVFLLVLVLALSLAGVGYGGAVGLGGWVRRIVARTPRTFASIGGATFLGCLAVAGLIHEPVPRVTDEFSYLLMSDTFATGRASNPALPLSEFFDTFHVLVHPVYASKYFAGQGLFLAAAQKLTGHPAVGVWLSSALACVAVCWMLTAWIGPTWGLLAGILMGAQYGIFSYWSQSYWGGMVAALGGALYFGAIRRLWERIRWQDSLWAALGVVILANSRPLEGAIAMAPVTGFLLARILRQGAWRQAQFWRGLVLPAGAVLVLGAAATGTYNRAITGSFWQPPYLLHEKQYQESPQFVFMPLRPKLTYSSPWVQYLFKVNEMRLYLSQRTPVNVMLTAARKLMAWWGFYFGILLSAPLVLVAWIKGGRVRWCQVAVLAGFVAVAAFYVQRSGPPRIAIDLLTIAQFVILWYVFDEFWPRLALATCGLILFESFFVKYAFPHYFAPATCLVLFLQVESLRRLWYWRAEPGYADANLSRAERRRAARVAAKAPIPTYRWRGFVLLLPLACLASLFLRVEARANGWTTIDIHPNDTDSLPMQGWSLKRAEMEQWLEEQPGEQLVFVRYFPTHDVNDEWVWNRADLMHAKIVWARDLGSDHNQLLLQQMPNRTVWSLLPDLPNPRLVLYSQVLANAPRGLPPPEPPAFPQQPEEP